MLAMLTIILRGKDYHVTARKSFDLVNGELETLQPGVIMIDKNLGDTDGLDVCRTIRAHPMMDKVIILIFSAYEVSADECRAAGATDCFEKPAGMQQFLESIEKYLH